MLNFLNFSIELKCTSLYFYIRSEEGISIYVKKEKVHYILIYASLKKKNCLIKKEEEIRNLIYII